MCYNTHELYAQIKYIVILYAAETYYNLSENELREIERVEEGFFKKIAQNF